MVATHICPCVEFCASFMCLFTQILGITKPQELYTQIMGIPLPQGLYTQIMGVPLP